MKYTNTPINFEQIEQDANATATALSSPQADYLSNYDAKTILRNPNFLRDLRDVYAAQNEFYDNDENLIDKFFSDNSWKEFNSISAALGVARSATADDAVKEKMARVQEVYDRFPNFWEAGGRSAFDALSDAVPAAVLDPINIIPVGKAAMMGKAAAKVGKNAFLAGAKEGAVKVGVVEGVVGAGFGTARELERVNTGQQDEVNLTNIALEAGFGAGLGGALGGAIGGVAGKMAGTQTRQFMARKANLENALPNLEGQEYADAVKEIGQINRILEDPNVNVVPTDAEVLEAPQPKVEEPEVEAEVPLTPRQQGEQNLRGLDEALVEDIEQLEARMGLRAGALSNPEQRQAFMNDPDRFDQAMFDEYQALQATRRKIQTLMQSGGAADALRAAAEKAAQKGDIAKSEKLNAQANDMESKWNFYATATSLKDLRGFVDPDFITNPDGVTARPPEAEAFRDQQAEAAAARLAEMKAESSAIMARMKALEDKAKSKIDDSWDSADLQSEWDLLQKTIDIEATDLEQFRKRLDDMDASEALQTQKIDEAIAKGDPELQAEWAKIKDDINATRQTEAIDATKKLLNVPAASPEAMDTLRGLTFDPATKTYIPTPEPKATKTADPVADKPVDPVPEPTEKKLSDDDFFESMGEAGALTEFPDVGKAVRAYVDDPENKSILDMVLGNEEAYAPYKENLDVNLKQAFPTGKVPLRQVKNYSDPNKATGDKEEALFTVNTSDVVFVSDIAEREIIYKDPKTGDLRSAFLDSASTPKAPDETPAAGFVDPGEPPEGMTIAIIKDGETPRKASQTQREKLANGDIDRVSLLNTLAGKTDGWEIVFAPIDAQPKSPNFMERILRLTDYTPAENEQRTFDFDINERDSIPSYDDISNNTIEISEADLKNYRGTSLGFVGERGKGGYATIKADGRTQRATVLMAIVRLTELEDKKLAATKKGQQKVYDEIEDLSALIPAYRVPEQTKAEAVDQLIGERGIFTKASSEDIATIRDILRRYSNARGILPKFQKSRGDFYMAYNSRKGETGYVGLTQNKGDGKAKTIGHELFHWMYFNILSPSEKSELNKIVLDRIYDEKGKLDYNALQEMSPLPLRTIGKRPLSDFTEEIIQEGRNQGLRSWSAISRNNAQEVLANQFNIYMNSRLPEQASVFEKVAQYLKAVVDRFLDGKRLDPDLARRFDRLLPESAQDILKGTGDAKTTAGMAVRDAFDELQAMRIDLEKAMAYPGGVGKKRIQEHGFTIAKFLSDPESLADIKEAVGSPEIMANLQKIEGNLETPADILNAANLLVDAHDMMDTNLKAVFKDLEQTNLAPAYPGKGITQIPNVEGASSKGVQTGLEQIKVSDDIRDFETLFNTAKASGSRLEVEGVILKFASRVDSYRNFGILNSTSIKDMGGKSGKIKTILEPLKNRMYGLGQSPRARDRDTFSALSDEAFMKEAEKVYAEAQDAFKQIFNNLVNLTKKNINTVNKGLGDTQAKKATNKRKAKATASSRRQAEDSTVSADAFLRTLTNDQINAELNVSTTDKRAADLSSELDRREAAQVPPDGEFAPLTNRKVQGFVRKEEADFRGVQMDDGIPNSAPAMVRESIRKITHRDPETQRMARGVMYRLINLSDGDQLRLLNVTDPSTGIAYNDEPFNILRNELRQLSRSVGGTGKNKLQNTKSASKKIAELVLRAAPPDADRYSAIQAAFDKADDPLKQGRDDVQWFTAHLVNAITGKGSRRPFQGARAYEANEMLEASVENAAYLMNGFIRKGEMRQGMKPLLEYGDMFDGVTPMTSPRRKINERSFVEGGLGADAEGNSVPWFHATPNKTPFGSRDFVWEPSRAIDNPRFGPGIYLGSDQSMLTNIYAKNPTLGAMSRMIETMVPKEEQGFAETLAYALSSTRMQINDIGMQMTRTDRMSDDVFIEELGRLRDAEESLVESLAEMGLETMPGVVETRVRAVAPIDIRNGVMYTVHHPNMRGMMDATVDNGLIPQETIDDLAVELGSLQGGFEGNVLYDRLIEEISNSQGLSEGLAKGELTTALRNEGFDSLRVTEQNRLPDSGIMEHEALVVFDATNVKSPDATDFDREIEFFHQESVFEEPGAPVGSLAQSMMDSGGTPDPNRMGAIIGEMEKSGLAQGAQVIMKKIRRQPLTPQEEELLHKANPLKYLMNNANRLRSRHMHWLADWTKPREGAGFHEKEINLLAGKVMPLMNAIRSLTGETPLTKWKDTVLSNPFSKKVKQHPASERVVKALRRGEKWAKENLKTAEMGLYNQLRAGFDSELQAMNDLGIGVGRITNYFPQVYDIEAIQTHQDEFVAVIAEMISRDRVANPNKVGSNPKEPRAVAQEIMLRIIDEEGVYIPEQKMRTTRNGKNPHTDYNRVLNLSATDDLGRLRYGDILEFMENRGFLVNNLDGVVAKYFEGTNKKILMHDKFGHGNHAYHDYIATRGGGVRTAVELLTSDKVITRKGLTAGDFGSQIYDDVRITEMRGMKETDAQMLVDNIVTGIADGTLAVPGIKKLLQMAKPNATASDLRRFEAIANGLWEYENFGAVKQSAGDFSDAYFAAIQGRNLEQTQASRMARQASKAIRNFNSVTLLSYTALTSLTDLAIPFLRGARMRDSMNVIRQSVGSGDNKAEYRAAISNIGAAMESQIHQRMSMLYGSAGGKITNQFFAANLLAPWTNLQRNIATATGYELLKAQQKIALNNFQPNKKSQNRSYKNAKRMLSEFGLGEYLTNGRSLDDLSLLDATNGDQNVRMALHRFANETIFTPNKSDVPLWAQGPTGAVVFQLKSYPLMFQKLVGKIASEAYNGNPTPALNFLILGTGAGAGTLAIKDLAQARGGEDDRSIALRERKLSSILEKMGYDQEIHGDKDDFLGWALESQVHLGGFGLLADIFYNVAAQADNGLYGATRILSTLAGPTAGAALDSIQFGQGLWDQALDLSPESNAKERAAWRFFGSRVPFLGGNRNFREGFAEFVGGGDEEKKSESYGATYGSKFGSDYGSNYGSK